MTSPPADILQLLRQYGHTVEPAALESLMRGVAAAPEGLAGPEWVELVEPKADAILTKKLSEWRADLAKADDGLAASPAPATRLAALRAELKRRGIDGFVVPRADQHQGEYVARQSQRLAWLTGFTGSAGLAIVLADRAAIFIDGRYTLQVRHQVDIVAFAPHQIPEQSPEAWIAENLPPGAKLGFDPWLQTVDGQERYAGACARAGGSFAALDSNPLDAVWHDRPAAPLAPVLPQPARPAKRAANASARSLRPKAPMWRCSPPPIRSPGCSTCAAAIFRGRLLRWASPCCMPTAMSTSTWTAARFRRARWPGSATPSPWPHPTRSTAPSTAWARNPGVC